MSLEIVSLGNVYHSGRLEVLIRILIDRKTDLQTGGE
jgi:hypothetical protein